ncbi:medium-chain fatty acid-CoA ligase faa2 [Sorochytrium milnesiophthora]
MPADSSATAQSPKKVSDISLLKQAMPVPGSARPGSSAVYRSALSPDALLQCDPDTRAMTIYEVFQHGVRVAKNGNCLGHRVFNKATGQWSQDYVWESYAQVDARVRNYGAGLMHLYDQEVIRKYAPQTAKYPQPPRDKWRLGLFSINRPEWVLGELACATYSLASVALYDTLGPDTIEYVINHAELGVLAASADKLAQLLKLKHRCPSLRVIVSMDELDGDMGRVLKLWAAEKGVLLVTQREVEKIGSERPREPIPPSPQDICTICYTSGTTGDPKGAILVHAYALFSAAYYRPCLWSDYAECFSNFASEAVFKYFGTEVTSDDVHISYLPLAHIMERTVLISMFGCGGQIAFYRGDVNQLVEDIQVVKPTIFVSVPRLFNRIHAKLLEGTVLAPGVRGMLFRRAVNDKMQRLTSGQGVHHLFWDNLLFNKVRQVLGGRVRMMVTGSAPLSKDTLQFLRLAFACDVLEGYGSTESTAGATIQLPGDTSAGNIGPPMPQCEVKLVDVPDMSYLATDQPYPRGEICIRGHNVFKGYLKDEAKTREALDEEGWLHTGDIGLIDECGRVTIIDRKKNIFKLAQGEYVAPEKIENIYLVCPLLAQVFVHGDSLQSKLVGVAVPNPDTYVPWAQSRGYKGSLAELCANKALKALLLQEMNKVAKEKKLLGFEMVADIFVEVEPFSIETGILTPTFKLKRPQAATYYRKHIDAMYDHITALGSSSTEPDRMMEKSKL